MADVTGGRIIWKLDVDSAAFEAQLAAAGASAGRVGSQLGSIGKVAQSGIASGLSGAIGSISHFSASAASAFGTVGDGISNLAGKFKYVGLAIGAAGAGLVGFGLHFASQLQTSAAAMQALTGSTQVAQQLFSQLYTFVRGTPFAFPDVAKAAQTLLGYGRSAQQVTGDIKVLGGIVATTGANWQNLAVVYGQVNAAGRLYSQDALQLINNGVPITTALAKQLGISLSDVKAKMEAGQISAEDFNKAIATIAPPDAIERLSKTMPGAISNLTGSLRLFAFGLLGIDYSKFTEGQALLEVQGGLYQKIRLGVLALSKAISSPQALAAMKRLGAEIGNVADRVIPKLVSGIIFVVNNIDHIVNAAVKAGLAIGSAFAVAKIGQGIFTLVNAATALASAFGLAGDAAVAANVKFLANPYVLAAVAVVALVVGIGMLLDHFNILKPTLKAVTNGLMAVYQWLANIGTAIWNFVKPAWDILSAAATVLWNAVTTMLIPAFQSLWDKLQPLMPVLEKIAIIFGIIIVGAILIFITAILLAVAIVVAVVAAIVMAVSFLVDNWTNSWNWIKNAASDAWNWIKNAVSDGVGFIVGIVSGGVSNVINIWNGINRIIGIVYGAFSGVVNAVRGGIQSAYNTVAGFVGRFSELGRDIINGIVNGILGAAGRIGSVLGDIAHGALAAAKAAVGAHSPSTLFAEKVGKPIAQGIAMGITQGAGEINNALGAVTSPNAISSVGAAQAGSSTNSPVSIHLHMEGIMARSRQDLREISKDMIESVNEELRSRRLDEIGGGNLLGVTNG